MPFDNAGFISEKAIREKQFREATKLHEILRIAIEDFKSVKAQPEKYKIEMQVWYKPLASGRCAVCLAGCVMALSLDEPRREFTDEGTGLQPGYWDADIYHKLCALNELRMGNIWTAYWRFHRLTVVPRFLEKREFSPARRSGESYVAFFERVHAILVKHDL